MNNKIIFAAAGNGKTFNLCNEAIKKASENRDKYILLISYTNEGIKSIENEYRKQNLGVIDSNVIIKSWYSFLLSDFIKPYQCLLRLKYKHYRKEYDISIPENYIKSIAFYQDSPKDRWYSKNHLQYFFNTAADIRKDDVSELGYLCNEHSNNKVINRLESLYSHIFIDELQDYAGWDLEIFKLLFNSNVNVLCVGDYKQSTYLTNFSLKNKQYRDEKIKDFFVKLQKEGLCQIEYAQSTRRFNKKICNFINTIMNDSQNCVIPYSQDMYDNIENIGVFILDKNHLDEYCDFYNPIILRYDKDVNVDLNHPCKILSYGGSKGTTFDRVVIFPVGTVVPFIYSQTPINSNKTRAKFYVACTRARYSVVFAIENPKETKYFQSTTIRINDKILPCLEYISE